MFCRLRDGVYVGLVTFLRCFDVNMHETKMQKKEKHVKGPQLAHRGSEGERERESSGWRANEKL